MFIVIDKKTGSEADVQKIALEEDWAKGLVYCDIDGWYLGSNGELVLADDCGRLAYPPADRFQVIFDKAFEDSCSATNCVLTMFGKCSYRETGCSDCGVKAKIREALASKENKNGT